MFFSWKYKEIYCAENEHFAIRKSCPKSCMSPSGSGCESIVYKEGCVCNNGYVLDSSETCVAYTDCGCKSNDGSQIINVRQ